MRNPIKLGILALITSAALVTPVHARQNSGLSRESMNPPAGFENWPAERQTEWRDRQQALARQTAEQKTRPSGTSLGFRFHGGTLKDFMDSFRQQSSRLGWQSFSYTTTNPDLVLPEFDLVLTRDSSLPPPDALLSLEFPGGTVSEFVLSLRAAARNAGSPINVVAPKEAEDIGVPRLSLQSVRAETALRAFASAFPTKSNYRFDIVNFPRNSDEAPSFAINFEDYTPAASAATPAEAHMAAMAAQRSPRSMTVKTEVFSVRDTIEAPASVAKLSGVSLSREDLLRAVDAAFSLEDKKTARPEVLFHPESGLLIVRGDGDQIDLVRDLLDRVGKDVIRRREAAVRADSERIRIKRERTQAENKVKSLERTLEILRKQFEVAEARKDLGSASSGEMAQMQLSFINAELEYRNAILDLEALDAAQMNDPVRPAASELKVVQYPLKHLSASDENLLRQLRNQVGEKGKVTANTQTNAIIIQATDEDQAIIAQQLGVIEAQLEQSKKKK